MILSLLQVVTPKQLWNNTEDRLTPKETTYWCVDFLKLREHLCMQSSQREQNEILLNVKVKEGKMKLTFSQPDWFLAQLSTYNLQENVTGP